MQLLAQENLEGRVLAKEGNETIPLIGANVFWLNSQIGTITNENGKFSLPYLGPEERIIISYVGFKSDTLIIKENRLLIKSIGERMNQKFTIIGKISNGYKKNLIKMANKPLNLTKFKGYSHKF